MLDVGQKLPAFSLENQDGQIRTGDSYAGKWLVLYVYPKDDTPGCTVQGKSFTASKADYDAAGAVVVGLSADDTKSPRTFAPSSTSPSSCSPTPSPGSPQEAGGTPMRVNLADLRNFPGHSGVPTEIAYPAEPGRSAVS